METRMQRYETCTPENISGMTEEMILELAKSVSDYAPLSKVRLALLKAMYNLLGFDLSNDLLFALLANVKQQLILACAGGCKTTSSQLVILLAKALWKKTHGRHLTSSEVLCLAYNRENRPQMDKKHADLLTPMIMSDFFSYDPGQPHYINAGVTSHTLHSFCKHWIDQHLPLLGIDDYSLLKEGDEAIFFGTAIRSATKEVPHATNEIRVERVQTLYDLVHGLCLTYDDISEKNAYLSDAVCSCNATVTQIKAIFLAYDNQKRFFKKYDFTDMLVQMNKLLDNPEIQERMRLLYTLVVVDEVQDFTPLMMSILKKIIGSETRLLAIGDEDQSIYGFRGADINNALRFKEHFPESKIFQLFMNRRCGERILADAATVIGMNKNRYDKKLIATRAGGTVTAIEYKDLGQQMDNITNLILESPKEERRSTVVCVREKAYGQAITYGLYTKRIPFHTHNARAFYYHEAFRGFIEVMSLLWKPARDNWRNLYKITNIKKSDWLGYIKYDDKKRRVDGFTDKGSLWELEFKPFAHYAGLPAALLQLRQISQQINSMFCKDYIDYIIKLFRQNFWETRIAMEPVLFSDEAFDWIRGVFAKSAPYPVLYEEFSDNMRRMRSDEFDKSGVTVATMHALKGLEYKNVHMAFMADSIFPAYMSIDSKSYSPDISQALKEAENRLAYVAMTRARDSLYLHYDSFDPSLYIAMLNTSPKQLGKTEQLVFSNKKKW